MRGEASARGETRGVAATREARGVAALREAGARAASLRAMPREFACEVAAGECHVRAMAVGHAGALGVGERPHDFRGDAEDEAVGRDHGALGDDGAGADEASPPHHGLVEDDRADTDEAIVLHERAVDDGAMADRDAVADDARDAEITMDDGAVLHVAVVADFDPVAVAANDRGGPDARALADGHVSKNDCVVVDEGAFVNCRQNASPTAKYTATLLYPKYFLPITGVAAPTRNR